MCFPVALVGEPGPEPRLPHPENGPNEGLMAGEQLGGHFWELLALCVTLSLTTSSVKWK